MDGPKMSLEKASVSTAEVKNSAPSVVFQPQKLKEVVEIIDLMGNVASRVREDNSGDAAGGMTASGGTQTSSGTSARDEAIAKAPPVPIMQKKLMKHLEQEIKMIESQARRLSRSNARGSAYLLNELYRKIRRLKALVADIVKATAETIKRFYISVFIDRQPMVVTGGSLVESDQ